MPSPNICAPRVETKVRVRANSQPALAASERSRVRASDGFAENITFISVVTTNLGWASKSPRSKGGFPNVNDSAGLRLSFGHVAIRPIRGSAFGFSGLANIGGLQTVCDGSGPMRTIGDARSFFGDPAKLAKVAAYELAIKA